MSSTAQDEDNQRIMLGLLQSVERDGGQSQRRLAAELGIALGLVNAYLKRCIKKGLVKVSEAPARRYAYYLTPHGFAEKSRLTVDYLSYSFSLFRSQAEYGGDQTAYPASGDVAAGVIYTNGPCQPGDYRWNVIALDRFGRTLATADRIRPFP
jgi:predicted transcriptional regulator